MPRVVELKSNALWIRERERERVPQRCDCKFIRWTLRLALKFANNFKFKCMSVVPERSAHFKQTAKILK
jgi:hypothetical protein